MQLDSVNLAILEYLASHGEEESCIEFYEELGRPQTFDVGPVHRKCEYKRAVLNGEFEKALDLIGLYEPQALVTNPEIGATLELATLASLASSGSPSETVLTRARTITVPAIERLRKASARSSHIDTLNAIMRDYVLAPSIVAPQPEVEALHCWNAIRDKVGKQYPSKRLERAVAALAELSY